MTTEDPSLWVRGYRAGWLYFYDYTRMLRLAPWPGVTLEIRGENGLWSAVPHESAIRLLPWVQWASTSVTYIGSDLWCEMNGQMVTGYALPSVERKVAWENLLIEKYLRASPIDHKQIKRHRQLAPVDDFCVGQDHEPTYSKINRNHHHRVWQLNCTD